MIGSLYIGGDSLLHRQPAWRKLLVLFAAGIVLFVVQAPEILAGAAVAAAAILATVRPPLRALRRQLTGVAIILAAIFAANAVFADWGTAFAMLFRLSTLVLLALAVTMTTRTSDMLEVVERVLQPLERTGLVNAARVSLAVSLAIRFVPEIFARYREIRDAQAARGLAGNPVALIVPLVVRTLKSAEEIAAAIDARGFEGAHPSGSASGRTGRQGGTAS
ncbi:energy-coupling factor transporter transmembrane component T family protein [Ferruginivarius sediminum]|uniref:Energy-coupling factor transporter transmembrane protein EcfT n=1 Tax=Ferruginivarius sediminum TaxID=2661937 RepID=A0A369T8B1_9PROT|nr:energy-coupling factor transporter transmembrane protein EcfT [Ferruginivarius sediminum]RDD61553.1 energy-coupling factor transporter transmembrane protein EcfT [Ferruginivarius sediminum]